MCFHCKQTGQVKRFCPLLSNSSSVGHPSRHRTHVQSFGQTIMRPTITPKSEAENSSGSQDNQRSQTRAQTYIFAMIANEAQANLDTISSIMTIFGSPTRVIFYSRSSKSFVSTSFTLYADWELSPLKHKLEVMTLLGEQIIRIFIFRGCEILIE